MEENQLRLNKYISNSGICSRREADKLIELGKVSVNNEIIKELGYKVSIKDIVKVNGKKIMNEKKVYYLMNKPKGYITTVKDPDGRRTVMDLLDPKIKERIYPVGRLDRNSSGLLLFTNDGELSTALLHPSSNIKKIYTLKLDKNLSVTDYEKCIKGVELEDGIIEVDEIAFINEKDKSEIGVEIHSGKNRILRRLFLKLGYEVVKLDRVMFGNLTKKDIPRGKTRELSIKEVRSLSNLAFHNKNQQSNNKI
jgi:23S rRNA pseudouridine2605 synthase